jgi:hypothetical protein
MTLNTAPQHHLSHQRSSSFIVFTTTTPCRHSVLLRQKEIVRRLADDSMFVVSTWSLR